MIKDPSPHLPGNPFEPNVFSQPGHAQAEATMALVFEQRTATLVSLLADPGVPDDIKRNARRQVLSRLGFDAATESKPKGNLDARTML